MNDSICLSRMSKKGIGYFKRCHHKKKIVHLFVEYIKIQKIYIKNKMIVLQYNQ